MIGSSKQETISLFHYEYETIEASSEHEVIAYQQWVSVEGPDYVEKTLYLTFLPGKLANWKITTNTTSVISRNLQAPKRSTHISLVGTGESRLLNSSDLIPA